MDAGTRGPQVDAGFRSSVKGVFAAGNLLRGVSTADHCALEGMRVARSIARYLKNAQWPASRIEVRVEAPIAWALPNVVGKSDDAAAFQFRSWEFRKNVRLVVRQGEAVLHSQSFRDVIVNEIMVFNGEWTRRVDFSGESIFIGLLI